MFSIVNLFLGKVKESQAIRLAVIGAGFVILGAVAFSITQGRAFTTSLYWAITTATTVGYGDVTPKNLVGRAVAVGTMLTTIPLFAAAFASFAASLGAARLGRLLHVGRALPEQGFVVIYGMDPTVPRVASELHAAGQAVVVVADTDGSSLPEAVHVVRGDPTNEDVIRRARPERARQVLLTGGSDGEVLVSAIGLHHVAPDVPTLAITQNDKVAQALRDLGISQTISADVLLGHTLAKSLETPHAAHLLLRLVDGQGYKLQEVDIAEEWIGQALSKIREEYHGMVLGLVHHDDVSLGVDRDPQVSRGDKLLVVLPDAPGRS